MSEERTIDTVFADIPSGAFMMGGDVESDHQPIHEVAVSAFRLAIHPVTNAQYEAFCAATQHRLSEFWGQDRYHCGPAFPDHPVVGVSWQDAGAFAEWAGGRLPTEAEWEVAARGGVAGGLYPFGDDIDPSLANYSRHAANGTLPVGSFAPNGFGLHDMSGNVVEWCADRYDALYYARSALQNPKGPDTGKHRVIRGGGWHSGPYCCRVDFRNALPANWVDFAVGFRLARDGSR
ncbi:formylglycine-generating enzyme family protein [Candidatus Bipolaricaulota bacterium]|nr:formylglycine-generating enzyme family protein [Candidatus Bipolaricaulota bacterium]